MLWVQIHRKPGSCRIMLREQLMFIGRKEQAEDLQAKANTAKTFYSTKTKQKNGGNSLQSLSSCVGSGIVF